MRSSSIVAALLCLAGIRLSQASRSHRIEFEADDGGDLVAGGWGYVPAALGMFFDAFAVADSSLPGEMQAAVDEGRDYTFENVASAKPGGPTATCKVHPYTEANKHLTKQLPRMAEEFGMPTTGDVLKTGFDFSNLVTEGSKSANPIALGQWGLLLKGMTESEAGLMEEFSEDFMNHVMRTPPNDPVTGEQCTQSTMMMKVLLFFGVQCTVNDPLGVAYEWSHWHLITNVNQAPQTKIHTYDIKASRPVNDCSEKKYYEGGQGKLGDYMQEYHASVQHSSCEVDDYQAKMPCFLEVLRQDLHILDTRRFIDYSLMVTTQAFDQEAEHKFQNMLHFRHNGEDLHLVVGLIDIIGLKTAGRKFQSNFGNVVSSATLFDQHKFKVYPYYLACLTTYIFDSQSCSRENPRCKKQFKSLSSAGVAAVKKNVGKYLKCDHCTHKTDADRRHKALARPDNCDLTMTCRALIFSPDVRSNFDACEKDAIANLPGGGPRSRDIRLRQSDAGMLTTHAQALAVPTMFRLYWQNAAYGTYYKYFFFVSPQLGGSLCWIYEKDCMKTRCNQRGNTPSCPKESHVSLKDIDTILLRAAPKTGYRKTPESVAQGLFLGGAVNPATDETLEIFGTKGQLGAWEENLKYLVGLMPGVQEEATITSANEEE